MNKICLAVLLLCTVISYSQNDAQNFKKYWKFRNSFRQNFVKIGPFQGESFPMARRNPGACVDNVNGSNYYGQLYWGDGFIRHGHYLGFLATEYRLLKNNGENVEGVLNELYFALYAVNRADKRAEQIITEIPENNLNPVSSEMLNGFYVREDVPEFFDERWKDEPIQSRGVHSVIYENNNVGKVHEGWCDTCFKASPRTTQWSNPSLDQMTSILLGLKVCHKLLDDNLWVQPTPNDSLINLKDEVEAITHRIVSFAADHNWFLLNMWGWPVGNGGGELALTAYPISVIGESITGNVYPLNATRQVSGYKVAREWDMQPTVFDQVVYFDTLSPVKQAALLAIIGHDAFAIPLDYPNTQSNFELWQSGGINVDLGTTQSLWETMSVSAMQLAVEDLEGNLKLDQTFPNNTIGGYIIENYPIDHFNQTIIFNLGVSSGIFSDVLVAEWADETNNYSMPLINAILDNNSSSVQGQKQFYQDLLNAMPIYGGFQFSALDNYNPNTPTTELRVWCDGWGGEYKWLNSQHANGPSPFSGQFSGLDYMYLHNLYSLIFSDELPEYEEEYGCFCEDDLVDNLVVSNNLANDLPATVPNDGNIISTFEYWSNNNLPVPPALKYKLGFLEFCTPNDLDQFTNNELTIPYDLSQNFSDYHDYGISLNKFQTTDFTIKSGGQLNVESRFVICEDKTMLIEAGGELNLNKGEVHVNENATLIVEGSFNSLTGTKIILHENATLIIKDGGQVFNNGYLRVKTGATVEYEQGAELKMTHQWAELHLDGGTLDIKDNAIFQLSHDGIYHQSGQLRLSENGSINGGQNVTFQWIGTEKEDPILILDENITFKINVANQDDLNYVKIDKGRIEFHPTAKMVIERPYFSNEARYMIQSQEVLNSNNPSIELQYSGKFFDCSIVDVSVLAPLYLNSAGQLEIHESGLSRTTDKYLPLVTVNSKSFQFNKTRFGGFTNIGVLANYQTETSNVVDCIFEGEPIKSPDGEFFENAVHIKNHSTTELRVSGSSFAYGAIAIDKSHGKLHLKCNSFSGFNTAGVEASNSCYVEMGSQAWAGYNTFTQINGYNVFLDNAEYIQLKYGYNTFYENSPLPIIDGTIQIGSPMLDKQYLHAHENWWNPGGTIPPQSEALLSSSLTGADIPIIMVNPASAPCGSQDPVTPKPVGVGGLVDLPKIKTPFLSDSTRLDIAIELAIAKSERVNDAEDDLEAIKRLAEILAYNFSVRDLTPDVNFQLNYAYESLKHTVYHAFLVEKISRTDNEISFHPEIDRYKNILNKLSNETLTTENYHSLFKLEMDKAHLFHILGKDDWAIAILDNLESCELDYEEQSQVNNWKYAYKEEIAMKQYGEGALLKDTIWVDTSEFKTPSIQPFGNFGSTVHSIDYVEFFNCRNPRMFDPENDSNEDQSQKHFKVYPNPTSGLITLTYDIPDATNLEIRIKTADGKEIEKLRINSGSFYHQFNLSYQARGVYYVELYADGVLTNTEKLIILD